MPVPHEKLPTCVPRHGQLYLALMQHEFLCVPEFASQVPTLPDPDTFAFDTGLGAGFCVEQALLSGVFQRFSAHVGSEVDLVGRQSDNQEF